MGANQQITEASTTRRSVPARHVAAVVLGNALEFYDFITYAFFAVYIGRTFFPSTSAAASLLASLGTFGVGFVTRPIGGLVIGTLGDRRGRKPAMILSFSLMGVAITGLALTPSRAAIGLAAPILVVFFRMLQGFALGGEVGPTTAFLLESAPPERRGFYTAFQAWTQDVSTLSAGIVGFALANLLTEQQLQTFGWRIAFLLGATIVPIGLMMRRNLPETFHVHEKAAPGHSRWRVHPSVVVIGVLLLASGTVGTYIDNYMTTFAIATLHMHANIAFAATIVVGLTGLIFDLPTAALSDRIGRKPVMLIPGIIILVSIVPLFHVILRYRTAASLLGATALFASLSNIYTCQVIIWLTESLPREVRSGGVAIIYALSIAAFGGTTQYAVTWFIKITGNPLAPAWYWTLFMAIGVVAMLLARESSPRKSPQRDTLAVHQSD
ncbi:MAG TPA: MFS transporter [Candidatus Acidoferrales bacterium]